MMHARNRRAAAVVGLVVAAAAPAAHSATCTATDYATLSACITGATAGDTVVFGTNVTLTGYLPVIDKSLVFDGNGKVLDGGGAWRAFFVSSGNVSISNLTIQNAVAKGGPGGIGTGAASGGGGGLGAGGALFVRTGASVTLAGITLAGNAATGGSGGTSGNSGIIAQAGGGGMGGAGGNAPLTNGGAGGGGFSAPGQDAPSGNGGGPNPGLAPGGAGGDYSGGGGNSGASAANGGAGGFAGGGGGSANGVVATGGAGGFGGGGGGGINRGGAGGFGGGAGAGTLSGAGTGGFGGGNSGVAVAGDGGGGGAGFGGAIFVMDGATLTIAGALSTSGSSVTAGAGGGGVAGAGMAAGAGMFLQGSTGTINVSPPPAQSVMLSETIADETSLGGSNARGLTIGGASIVQFLNTHTYTGPTTVNGNVLVNGTLASPFTVASGGQMGGSGSVPSLTGSSGSLINPSFGAIATTQLTAGTANLQAGSSFIVIMVSSGTNSSLKVTSGVTLAGSLSIAGDDAPGYTHVPGTVQRIIDNTSASPVSGTFAGIPEGGIVSGFLATHNFQVSYAGGDGNDVTLTALAPPVNTYTAPSPVGAGTITATFTGGGSACTFATSQFIPLTGHPRSPPAGSAPADVKFPYGLFDFTTANCVPGSTIAMTVTYPAPLPAGTQYWKYGPTPTNASPHWYVLPATIAGNTATFTITDGALGDDDLAANGAIVDQGGPGVPIVAVPTLAEWAMLLLALAMMGFGVRALRVRP